MKTHDFYYKPKIFLYEDSERPLKTYDFRYESDLTGYCLNEV